MVEPGVADAPVVADSRRATRAVSLLRPIAGPERWRRIAGWLRRMRSFPPAI